MDVTAIMEKTVKNTGGVAALQKILKKCQKLFITINGKNTENTLKVSIVPRKPDKKTGKKTY